MKRLRRGRIGLGFALSALPAVSFALTIDFQAGSTLAGNSAALAALQRAAAQWTSQLLDPITVTIDVDFRNFQSSNIIGGATSVELITQNDGYDTVRNQLVADSANETDDGIVASLPTAQGLSAQLPSGFSLNGEVLATKANFKAMGFTGLDQAFGAIDGTIRFNSQFNFDFDSSNGVSGGSMDFETVAAHEIGHILGFVSIVDDIDTASTPGPVPVMPLDLFRFNSAALPTSAAEFTTQPRELRPGQAASLDDLVNVFMMSTGANGGDGRQASHFKDDAFAGVDHIGIMDPTLAYGTQFAVTTADLRALDLIGYDYVSAVPLPAAGWLMGAAVGWLAWGGTRSRRVRPRAARDPEHSRSPLRARRPAGYRAAN